MFTPPKQVTCHVSCVTCHVSHVTCHMSRVTCHVSHVTCHMSHVVKHMSYIYIYFFFFGQFGEAYWWRVCYQRGLLRLFFLCFRMFIIFGLLHKMPPSLLLPLSGIIGALAPFGGELLEGALLEKPPGYGAQKYRPN